jgi:hypothetical protein
MELTPDNIKVLGGALVASLGIVATAIGFLIRTAYKLGQDASKVATSLESLTEIKAAVKHIPLIETRLGTVEEAWRSTRSDIKHLLRRPSQPDFDGEE